jgi:hypothetical protein
VAFGANSARRQASVSGRLFESPEPCWFPSAVLRVLAVVARRRARPGDLEDRVHIRFSCRRCDDAWRNERTDEVIDAGVIGWREWDEISSGSGLDELCSKSRLSFARR